MAVGTVMSGHTGNVTFAGVAQMLNIHEWTLRVNQDIFEYKVFTAAFPQSGYSSIPGPYEASGTISCLLDDTVPPTFTAGGVPPGTTPEEVGEFKADRASAAVVLKAFEGGATDRQFSFNALISNRRMRVNKSTGLNELVFDYEVDGELGAQT